MFGYALNNPINLTDPSGLIGFSPGQINSGGGGEDGSSCIDEKCAALNARDTRICNSLPSKRRQAICHASASLRYGNCLAGKPLPPLSYSYSMDFDGPIPIPLPIPIFGPRPLPIFP